MKVFLGCSSEAAGALRPVQGWLKREMVLSWDMPGTFRIGYATWDDLLRLANTVDGAIIVFTEDDLLRTRKQWYPASRDNVWLEFGLFVGALGRDRVLPIFVGKPKVASDFYGITQLRLPSAFWRVKRSTSNKKAISGARKMIASWASNLTPRVLRGLTKEIRRLLAPMSETDVETILRHRATAFLSEKSVKSIRALCASKGKFAQLYYGKQFRWTTRKSNRSLQRVFVRTRTIPSDLKKEFSRGEWEGIRLHLETGNRQIDVRWIWDSDEWFEGGHDDSLGFCVFGMKWFVHWGLRSGYCYREGQKDSMAKLLSRHFDALWKHSERFDREMISQMFGEKFADQCVANRMVRR